MRFVLKSCCSKPRACKFICGSILAALGLMVILRIFSAATFHLSKATICSTRVRVKCTFPHSINKYELGAEGVAPARKSLQESYSGYNMNLYNCIMHFMQLFRLR